MGWVGYMADTYFIAVGEDGSPKSRGHHVQFLARALSLTIDDFLLAVSSCEVIENIHWSLPSGPGTEFLKPL